jgi:hypothetical protein
MVVGDHDVLGFTTVEAEDDAVLVVHADAVLAAEVALQLLQVVARLDRSLSSRAYSSAESFRAAVFHSSFGMERAAFVFLPLKMSSVAASPKLAITGTS